MSSGKKDTRYHSLDFWRGVACLLVVLYHSSFYVLENPANKISDPIGRLSFRLLDHFWIGVPLFFVISGYCITAACDTARSRMHPLKQYFFRRFRRIFPPFWIAVGLQLGLMVLALGMGFPTLFFDKIHPFHPPASLSIWQWAGNLSLTEIWRENLVGPKRWFFLGPSWSLCYEEQFYAICGLMLLLSRRWFFRCAACLTVLVAAVAVVHNLVTPLPIEGFFFDGRWLLFAAGMLVYYRIHLKAPATGPWAEMALFGAFALSLVWKFARQDSVAEEYYIGFGFGFLLSVLHRWDLPLATNKLLRPITWCGLMCYSLYLVHFPFVKITSNLLYNAGIQSAWATLGISLPVSMVTALGVGWAFHFLVERRFLNTRPVLPWQVLSDPMPLPPQSIHPEPAMAGGSQVVK